MRWHIALTIFRKEILETLRDRRTLMVMLLLPLVLYPGLIIIFGQLVTHQISKMEEIQPRVTVKGQLPESLKALIEDDDTFIWKPAFSGPDIPEHVIIQAPDPDDKSNPYQNYTAQLNDAYQEWARQVLGKGNTDLIIVIPADAEKVLAAKGILGIGIYYDETDQQMQVGRNRLVQLLVRWRRVLQQDALASNPHLTLGQQIPLVFEEQNVATAEKRGGFIAGRVIPLVLMVMVMLGAFYPAIDLTAGEKERGTMQTLMTAPALANEIITGKFLAVFSVAIISAFVNLVSMGGAVGFMLKSTQAQGSMELHISFSNTAMALLQLVPIAVFFSAIMLAIAVFAHSFKEAQNYLTPVYMLVIIPAALSALPTIQLDAFTAGVPALNTMLLLRELFVQPPELSLIAMVFIANIAYAIIALALAVNIFKNEQILLSGQPSFRQAFKLADGDRQQPDLMLVLTVFALNLVILFYVGSYVQEKNIFWGMLITQWILMLMPVLLVCKGFRFNLKQTLLLNSTSWKAWAGCILLGLTSWAVIGHAVAGIQELFLPMPESFRQQMEEILGLRSSELSIVMLVIAFCVSPAVCEEFFFRGLMLAGVRDRFRLGWVVLINGAMFGIFHISIYRVLPTGVLGILLAWVAYRSRSIYTTILLHFINNFMAIMIMKYGLFPQLSDPKSLDWRWMAGVSILFFIGIYLISSLSKQEVDASPNDEATIPEH